MLLQLHECMHGIWSEWMSLTHLGRYEPARGASNYVVCTEIYCCLLQFKCEIFIAATEQPRALTGCCMLELPQV
jgi:hypothetical protein